MYELINAFATQKFCGFWKTISRWILHPKSYNFNRAKSKNVNNDVSMNPPIGHSRKHWETEYQLLVLVFLGLFGLACVAGLRRGGVRKGEKTSAWGARRSHAGGRGRRTFSLPRSFWLSSLPFYGLSRSLSLDNIDQSAHSKGTGKRGHFVADTL